MDSGMMSTSAFGHCSVLLLSLINKVYWQLLILSAYFELNVLYFSHFIFILISGHQDYILRCTVFWRHLVFFGKHGLSRAEIQRMALLYHHNSVWSTFWALYLLIVSLLSWLLFPCGCRYLAGVSDGGSRTFSSPCRSGPWAWWLHYWYVLYLKRMRLAVLLESVVWFMLLFVAYLFSGVCTRLANVQQEQGEVAEETA